MSCDGPGGFLKESGAISELRKGEKVTSQSSEDNYQSLEKYVTDGTSAEGQKCPNCGNETLVYQEGCLICKTCGTSRCG